MICKKILNNDNNNIYNDLSFKFVILFTVMFKIKKINIIDIYNELTYLNCNN